MGVVLKKFLLVMGIVFTGLVGSCMFVLGGVGLNAAAEAPQNKSIAVAMTRDLAKAWDVNDLKPHFVSSALSQINFSQAQQSMNPMKALGALQNVEEVQQTAFNYNKPFSGETTKTATITMVAQFENGRANVTIQLANEGNVMKLMHVNVKPIGDVRMKKQAA
jgi:hypothetical protein